MSKIATHSSLQRFGPEDYQFEEPSHVNAATIRVVGDLSADTAAAAFLGPFANLARPGAGSRTQFF